jgi:hypothetical protein
MAKNRFKKKLPQYSNGGWGYDSYKMQTSDVPSSSFNRIYGDGTAQAPGKDHKFTTNMGNSSEGNSNNFSANGVNWAAAGNIAGEAMKTPQGERPSLWREAGGNAAQWAGTGYSVAGPWGALAGAVGGAIYGGISGVNAQGQYDTNAVNNYNNSQQGRGGGQSIYAFGGETDPPNKADIHNKLFQEVQRRGLHEPRQVDDKGRSIDKYYTPQKGDFNYNKGQLQLNNVKYPSDSLTNVAPGVDLSWHSGRAVPVATNKDTRGVVQEFNSNYMKTPKGRGDKIYPYYPLPEKAYGGELNEFNGPSHEEGGITLGGDQPFAEVEGQETSAKLPDESGEEGQYIYSDRLKPKGSKRTFAQLSKSIENKYKRRPGDKLSEASKMRDLEALKAQQEQVREAMIADTYKKAYGGDLPKYNFGDWLAKPSTQTGIYDAAGTILPQIGPQTYMNKTMGKQRQMVNSLQPTQLSSNLVSDRESQEAIRDGYNTGEYNLRQRGANSGSYLAGMTSLAGKRMRESAGAHERVNNMNSQIKNATQAQQAQLNTQYDFTKAGMNFGIDRDYHAALSESTGYASRALKAPQDRRNEKLSLMANAHRFGDPKVQKYLMDLIEQQYGV